MTTHHKLDVPRSASNKELTVWHLFATVCVYCCILFLLCVWSNCNRVGKQCFVPAEWTNYKMEQHHWGMSVCITWKRVQVPETILLDTFF